jgi:homocysteine S-methyltransferase
VLAAARTLYGAGATVVNVADSPVARMKMSPWAVCHLIQTEVGLETVLNFPTRGRNLLRIQGDLLAAHALNIRNLFVVMGDPTTIGDYPEAFNHHDVVPSGLICLVKQRFNAGVDYAGQQISQATNFLVGGALNLNAVKPEGEANLLKKKIDNGVDFAMTQPIYTLETLDRFLERYEALHGPLNLPVIVSLLPLYSAGHARFLHNEVPGISIPQKMQDRLEKAGDKAPQEGLAMTRELIAVLKESVAGVYIMPPFKKYNLAAELVEFINF